jgi:hypothetical protein
MEFVLGIGGAPPTILAAATRLKQSSPELQKKRAMDPSELIPAPDLIVGSGARPNLTSSSYAWVSKCHLSSSTPRLEQQQELRR